MSPTNCKLRVGGFRPGAQEKTGTLGCTEHWEGSGVHFPDLFYLVVAVEGTGGDTGGFPGLHDGEPHMMVT